MTQTEAPISTQQTQHHYTKWILRLLGLWLVVLIAFGVWIYKAGRPTPSPIPPAQIEPAEEKKVAPTESVKQVDREVVIGLTTNTDQLIAGQTARVQVIMNSIDTRVSAVDLVVEYDPEVLSFVKLSDKILPDVLLSRNDPKTGRLMISLKSDQGQLVQTGDVLAELEFRVKKAAPTRVRLVFESEGNSRDTNLVMMDQPGQDALMEVSPAEVVW